METVSMAGPWTSLGLSQSSLRFLTESLGFPTMAPVQAATIPQVLKGMDVIVEAITGSGKTLSYAVPMFEMMIGKHREMIAKSIHTVHSIVIVPTRELGMQVCEVLHKYADYVKETEGLDVRVMRAVGGYDTQRDLQHYKDYGCHALVATPGRLYELVSLAKGEIVFRVGQVELCVLDEADRLLAMGFLTQLDDIFKRLPKQRVTALFSATQTRETQELARCGLRRPVVINVRHTKGLEANQAALPANTKRTREATNAVLAEQITSNPDAPQIPQQLKNYYVIARYGSRLEKLIELMRAQTDSKVLIYALTCASVEWLVGALTLYFPATFPIAGLHGQMSMSKRVQTHTSFLNHTGGCAMVCTDVAARGLDIPDIDLVIQYDAPTDPRAFVHRIGRTARMGREGKSILFLAPHEEDCVPFMKIQNVILEKWKGAGGSNPEDDDDNDEYVAKKVDKDRTLGSAMLKKGDRARAKKANLERKVIEGDLVDNEIINTLRRSYVNDRTVMELATRAFAAFIRGYKEHHLRYIFKFNDLDIVDLCNGFGLFHVPNCSETRVMNKLHIPLPEEFQDLNVKAITHADPNKERKRQEKLKRREEQKEIQRSVRNENRQEIREAKDISRHKKKLAWKQLEIDEIMAEGALLKKLKKGKITEEEYRRRTGEVDVELESSSRRERKKLLNIRKAQLAKEKDAPSDQSKEDPSFVVVGGIPPAAEDAAVMSGDEMDIDTTPRNLRVPDHKRAKKKKH
eukprot:PhF_6_TR25266/c0_g1_i1/m.34814/K14809/DDX55, SPB4; ATP-dependent RNA helicase DDX55/SPB4